MCFERELQCGHEGVKDWGVQMVDRGEKGAALSVEKCHRYQVRDEAVDELGD